jgi:hypothetical protein
MSIEWLRQVLRIGPGAGNPAAWATAVRSASARFQTAGGVEVERLENLKAAL